MVYSKRIPTIKLILTIKEYNCLIGVLNEIINEYDNGQFNEIANLTKEKLLKLSIPKLNDENNNEIEIKLYNNEVADIVTLLIEFSRRKVKDINYYQLLLKVRESISDSK